MRLNTDNAQTMPITDSVYGKPPKRPAPPPTAVGGSETNVRPPFSRPLWRAISQHTLDHLAKAGKDTKRLAARRRQERS